jgi:hypothetical protein
MAITLNTVNKSLELITSSSATVHVSVSYVDADSTTYQPKESNSVINTAGTTTILSAPASNHHHGAKNLSVFNTHATASNTVVVQLNANSTLIELAQATLGPAESMQWTDAAGWCVLDAQGRRKEVAQERDGYSGHASHWYKSMTAADAAGYWYCSSKDAGAPGVWAPGTPGLAGRATDGTTSADYGGIYVPTASSGTMYCTGLDMSSTQTGWQMLFDVLWVNTGIVVTTTTAQTINSVAFPARDANGTVNGEGCRIGLLTTTANTNAGTISNSTVTYTNSTGVGSKVATLTAQVGSQIPATPVIGTITWFNLANGCTGVQSIQSITLGTSLAAGAVSLIVARPIISASVMVANAGSTSVPPMNPGVRLYTGTTLLHCTQATGTGTPTTSGIVYFQER